MLKVFVLSPENKTEEIINAMAEAGAGIIGNYSHNAFVSMGVGHWKSEKGSKPYIGKVGKFSKEQEVKIEMVCPEEKLTEVIKAIKKVHPYETPAIDVIKLEN